MFAPIERYFIDQGFDVHGEVNDCDVVAVKGEKIIIIELKRNLHMNVLMQAAKRQRLTNDVYIAVLAPKTSFRSRKRNDLRHLLRRLELGLLTVSFEEDPAVLDHVIAPKRFDRKCSIQQSKKGRAKLLEEIAGRHKNMNVGGSYQTEMITAYREMCIFIACCLNRFGPLSAKKLRELGTSDKTYSILYNNYYGWFMRESKGIYGLTQTGKHGYQTYEEVAEHYDEKVSKIAEKARLLDL